MSHPHVQSMSKASRHLESSINEDNIFAISLPIVKATSWNLGDLTFHRQGVFDKKRKNLISSCARQELLKIGELQLEKSIRNHVPPTRRYYEKARPKQKRIMKGRNNLV